MHCISLQVIEGGEGFQGMRNKSGQILRFVVSLHTPNKSRFFWGDDPALR